MKHFQLIVLIGIVLFCLSSISIIKDYTIEASGQYPIIDGIKCDGIEQLDFHYHAHLNIFVNGSPYLIPGGIGIKLPDCIYWLHTHDASGLIHIESPQNNTFKLGQFFDICGQKFNNSQIFVLKADNSTDRTLTVYLNGTTFNRTSYRDIPILNRQDIVIIYGVRPPEIPQYRFLY
ncbi:MAG TPA: hypothetical protein VH481_04510 [Nitrososphaeraceae archaeon]|jgi:hypothetical protein